MNAPVLSASVSRNEIRSLPVPVTVYVVVTTTRTSFWPVPATVPCFVVFQ